MRRLESSLSPRHRRSEHHIQIGVWMAAVAPITSVSRDLYSPGLYTAFSPYIHSALISPTEACSASSPLHTPCGLRDGVLIWTEQANGDGVEPTGGARGGCEPVCVSIRRNTVPISAHGGLAYMRPCMCATQNEPRAACVCVCVVMYVYTRCIHNCLSGPCAPHTPHSYWRGHESVSDKAMQSDQGFKLYPSFTLFCSMPDQAISRFACCTLGMWCTYVTRAPGNPRVNVKPSSDKL